MNLLEITELESESLVFFKLNPKFMFSLLDLW